MIRLLRHRVLAFALLPLALAISGCEVGYIVHGAYEEIRLLLLRKPIDEVLAKPDLNPEIRSKLELVLQVRKFAQDQLGLNVGGAYETVVPVDKSAVTWVLMAAPRDRLAPYTWHFPIVGNVPYKGFFERASAEAAAAQFEAQGLDTFVRPAVAFSSLGYFNDPLLSNLLALPKVVLAGVVIHELFHRTYFAPSDVMWDESAANFVGTAGAVLFFAHAYGAESPQARQARAVLRSNLVFSTFMELEVARLLKLYSSGLPPAEILRQRRVVFARIVEDYKRLEPTLSGLDRFGLSREPLNNAVIVNYRLYFHRLKYFAAIDRLHHGNLRATIAAIIKLAKSDPADPFNAMWKASRDAPPAPPFPPAVLSKLPFH